MAMTVKELIGLLQEIDEDKEVEINVRSYYKNAEEILEFEGQNRIIIS